MSGVLQSIATQKNILYTQLIMYINKAATQRNIESDVPPKYERSSSRTSSLYLDTITTSSDAKTHLMVYAHRTPLSVSNMDVDEIRSKKKILYQRLEDIIVDGRNTIGGTLKNMSLAQAIRNSISLQRRI